MLLCVNRTGDQTNVSPSRCASHASSCNLGSIAPRFCCSCSCCYSSHGALELHRETLTTHHISNAGAPAPRGWQKFRFPRTTCVKIQQQQRRSKKRVGTHLTTIEKTLIFAEPPAPARTGSFIIQQYRSLDIKAQSLAMKRTENAGRPCE